MLVNTRDGILCPPPGGIIVAAAYDAFSAKGQRVYLSAFNDNGNGFTAKDLCLQSDKYYMGN
jgi:hypothetical protein